MQNSYLILCNNDQCMHRHGCSNHKDQPSKVLIMSHTQIIFTDMGYDCADFEFLTVAKGGAMGGFV